jgi:hypothetical protein
MCPAPSVQHVAPVHQLTPDRGPPLVTPRNYFEPSSTHQSPLSVPQVRSLSSTLPNTCHKYSLRHSPYPTGATNTVSSSTLPNTCHKYSLRHPPSPTLATSMVSVVHPPQHLPQVWCPSSTLPNTCHKYGLRRPPSPTLATNTVSAVHPPQHRHASSVHDRPTGPATTYSWPKIAT